LLPPEGRWSARWIPAGPAYRFVNSFEEHFVGQGVLIILIVGVTVTGLCFHQRSVIEAKEGDRRVCLRSSEGAANAR
jgi:hypothetical protein